MRLKTNRRAANAAARNQLLDCRSKQQPNGSRADQRTQGAPLSERRRRLRYLEHARMRDERVPLDDDDPEMNNGWRCIPVPPSDDPRRFILDSSHDYKTTWGRWVHCGEVEGEA